MVIEHQVGNYLISTSKSKLDLEVIYHYLVSCYWATGIPKETVARSIEHSLCFGVYKNWTFSNFSHTEENKGSQPLVTSDMQKSNTGVEKVLKDSEQVGFCRVITDYATFMYLADVFILEGHRGQKLGIALIDAVVQHPDLQGIRTWTLLTRDAHGLYRKFNFENHIDPTRFMIRNVPNPYDKGK